MRVGPSHTCHPANQSTYTSDKYTEMEITKIEMLDVLPNVFAGQESATSDIWCRNVTFERGHKYIVSAHSGTGKSSLCSYLYGFRNDYAGHILFDGTDIATLGVKQWCELRCRHLAYLPQEMRLFPELTAIENVELKNRLTGRHSRSEIEAMFERLGIAEKINQQVATLSIGQQQRVAIIRAVCQPFDFILLDEPVSHLDEANNHLAAALVADEAASQGAGIIATSVGNNVMINIDKEYKL